MTALLVGVVLVLLLLDRGSLATPTFTTGAGFDGWLSDRGPVEVVMTGFRLIALVLALHLLASSALAATSRVLNRPGLGRAAVAFTLPPFRRLVMRMAGVGLSATILVSSPMAPASAESTTVESTESTATLRLAPAPSPEGEATLVEVDETRSRPIPAPAPAPATEAGSEAAQGRHVVGPGDHLWLIAERRLGESLGRPATDAETGPYWQRVVEANPQLVDPDLLFPGDVVIVPEP